MCHVLYPVSQSMYPVSHRWDLWADVTLDRYYRYYVPAGVYHIVPSTFEPSQLGKFFLTVGATNRIRISKQGWKVIREWLSVWFNFWGYLDLSCWTIVALKKICTAVRSHTLNFWQCALNSGSILSKQIQSKPIYRDARGKGICPVNRDPTVFSCVILIFQFVRNTTEYYIVFGNYL